jgi:hypothetical protein
MATNAITAIVELRPPTLIGSHTHTGAIHEYINGENDMRSHITTLMMEKEPVSETSDFINLLTRLSARENVTDVLI